MSTFLHNQPLGQASPLHVTVCPEAEELGTAKVDADTGMACIAHSLDWRNLSAHVQVFAATTKAMIVMGGGAWCLRLSTP